MDVDSDDGCDTLEQGLKQLHFLAWILTSWINSISPILWESNDIFNLDTVITNLCLHVFLTIFSMLKLIFSDSSQKDSQHSNHFLEHWVRWYWLKMLMTVGVLKLFWQNRTKHRKMQCVKYLMKYIEEFDDTVQLLKYWSLNWKLLLQGGKMWSAH